MIGKVIAGRLAGNTSADSRVYPLLLPQDPTLPAVTYRVVTVTREHAFGSDANLATARVQVDGWAATYAEARTLGDEVAASLSRFRGTVNAIDVQDIALDNEQELYEDDTDLRRISQDYIISFEE